MPGQKQNITVATNASPTSSALGRKIVFGHGDFGTAGADAEGFRCPAPLPFEPKEPRTSPLKKIPGNVYKEMFILKRLLQILGFCSENKCIAVYMNYLELREYTCILGKHGAGVFNFQLFFSYDQP